MLSRARLVMVARLAALTVVLTLGLVVRSSPPASGAAVPVSGCAWAAQIGDGGIDGYAADLNASYWVTSFLATPGTSVTIDGAFPHARYFSFSAYNTLSQASDGTPV